MLNPTKGQISVDKATKFLGYSGVWWLSFGRERCGGEAGDKVEWGTLE